MKQNYLFARKWLDKTGNKIFVDGQEVLKYKLGSCHYEIVPFSSSIVQGDTKIVDDGEVIEISYKQLNEMGFGVQQERIPMQDKIDKYQKYRYNIIRRTWKSVTLTDLLKGQRIQMDKKNQRVRVVGTYCGSSSTRPNVGEWVMVKQKVKVEDRNPYQMADLFFQNDQNAYEPSRILNAENMGEAYSNKKRIVIKEKILMVSNEDEIICLPDTEDMQKIGIFGQSGTGKSLESLRVVGEIFYKGEKDRIISLNDTMSQFHACNEPMKNPDFVRQLKVVGEEPTPLPIVNLYIGNPKLKIPEDVKDVSFVYTINAYEFFMNYAKFTQGIDGCDLGAPIRYMEVAAKQLSEMKDPDDVEFIMQEVMPKSRKGGGETSDGFTNMIFRWKSAIRKIYRLKMLDSNYADPMIRSNWTVKYDGGRSYTGNPVICLALARTIPNLNTHSAKSYEHCRAILADVSEKVLEFQMEHSREGLRFWLFLDEIRDLYGKGMKKDSDWLSKILGKIVTQGRFQRIGLVYNIQSIVELNNDLIGQATTLICFKITYSDSERKLIQKTFKLSNEETKLLSDLNKDKKEMIAINNEPFIVYDRDGNRKLGRTFYKGYLIPPFSNTLRSEEVQKDDAKEATEQA